MIVDAYIHRLHLSIDHALAVSYRRNLYDGKTAFVAHISLVKGIPFYGYHVGYKFFLKIYMLNPLHMARLAELLQQGTVMKKAMQPYESHMQYLLQWMCDYNLYGCAYIDCSEVKFRTPVPDYLEMTSTVHQWHDRTIPTSMISDEEKLPRQSHCSIEVDIRVQDILNRLDIKSRPLHHDFIERTNPLGPDEKLVHSMAGLWRDEIRRRRARMGETDPDSSPFPPEVMISMSAERRSSQRAGWIHEEEYMEKIMAIIAEERMKFDGRKVAFEGFVQKQPFEERVKTVLESVEDLFPINLPNISISQKVSQQKGEDVADGLLDDIVDVDESRLTTLEDDDFPYGLDEDLAPDLQMSQQEQGGHAQEKHVNGEIIETMYDDEAGPDGDNYGEQFKDPKDPVPAAEPTGPNSSSELEALGIRKAGDYSHVEEDAFEIPLDYSSDINAAIARHRRGRALTLPCEPPKKIRKLIHEPFPVLDTFPSNLQGLDGESNELIVLDGQRELPDHCEKNNNFGTDAVHMTGQSTKNASSLSNAVAPESSAQGTLKISNSDGNRTLTFPVVKDPQDPYTIQRLSQRSNSPVKGSRNSEGKNVSFDTSPEIVSEISSNPKSESMKSESTNLAMRSNQVSSQGLKLSSRIHGAFNLPCYKNIIVLGQGSPPGSEMSSMIHNVKIPSVIYQDAYYGDERDVPERAREYAGREFKLGSNTVPYLPNFDPTGTSSASIGEKPGILVDKIAEERIFEKRRRACGLKTWEIAEPPPQRVEVETWLRQGQQIPAVALVLGDNDFRSVQSQIDGPSQKNRHGFKYSQRQKSTSVRHETQYMSIMGLEVHVNTRGNLLPNPEEDEIACVFWCLQSDDEDLEVNGVNEGTHVGILALSGNGGLARKISQQTTLEVEEESSELDLINRMVDIVRHYDPDILTGYEVHGGSWGYLIERARFKYDYNLCDEFSRMKSQSHGRFGKENDRWGFNHTSTIRVTGRHMINIWRAMRGELNLLQYTMENVVFHLLHRRIPHYQHRDLTAWYKSNKPRDLAKMLDYYVSRVQMDLEILEQNELVPRTSEQARLLGVDFFSVFSRGSQFKVESLMFRIAKPENFLLVSPSRRQVGQQNALECLPLVMEPQSAFYSSPLLVLDFQSLYPSVMIAYNYCYSTFLGRVVNWRGQNKMGFTDFRREQKLLELLKEYINIAPNGIMYVKPEIRKSLLAKMLGEILETRVMVKSGMKVDIEDKTLQRLLNNRQLALKLIANVTYGYTSASFSGRMPCSEIADSIVQTGRETLEKAIALIHSVERWGAEVVYGDTDSLFVYLKGRTKDEAFDIGEEIAKTITEMNPRPVKLKFEKVYFPCLLLAKKRYVGFKYESRSQKEPEFDAKGIETVRRDGTPAEQKIEERALKILFRTADLSQVKSYFQKQCTKIMKGKVSIQDFCFAKEVKLGTYSEKGPPPPGALISSKRMLEDPRAEPQYGERVPYVVITGAPGARLIDRCVAPDILLRNEHSELDADYYISKNLIPPLERIFNLVGANVRQWYDEMPKFQRIRRIEAEGLSHGKSVVVSKKTLESYMKSSACLVCREKLEAELPLCSRCLQHAETSLLTLRTRLNSANKKAVNLQQVCRSCAGIPWGDEVKCASKDCPVFYTRTRQMASLGSTRTVTEPVIKVLEEAGFGALEW